MEVSKSRNWAVFVGKFVVDDASGLESGKEVKGL